ncbi:unnamed protein product [Durusdinium trenchii]|uniref:Uncharacterized protein n=1 Tax=Durusdinium trenchii TaxID=1381693 RepID=A0ABP0RA31_9DINO
MLTSTIKCSPACSRRVDKDKGAFGFDDDMLGQRRVCPTSQHHHPLSIFSHLSHVCLRGVLEGGQDGFSVSCGGDQEVSQGLVETLVEVQSTMLDQTRKQSLDYMCLCTTGFSRSRTVRIM